MNADVLAVFPTQTMTVSLVYLMLMFGLGGDEAAELIRTGTASEATKAKARAFFARRSGV